MPPILSGCVCLPSCLPLALPDPLLADQGASQVTEALGKLDVGGGGAAAAAAQAADEYEEIDELEEEGVAAGDEATVTPGGGSSGGGGNGGGGSEGGVVLKTRTYDITITYDKYYQTPRFWLFGYREDGQPLSNQEVFEDIMPVRLPSRRATPRAR